MRLLWVSSMISVGIGYMADLLFGDPYSIPHPIRFIGRGIKNTEEFIRGKCNSDRDEKLGGIVLAATIVISTYFIVFLLLKIASWIHPYGRVGLEGFLIFQILAAKSLDIESRKVWTELRNKDILGARKYLGYIVGRDTQSLNEKEITRATVETVAENISDGIVAPLFYIIIGGPALGMAYKAVNTLDSMVGYKNEKYLYLGWASAKLDDVANYIPARLTACFILLAGGLGGYDWKNGLKIVKRDRRNHKSPNSGYPESAVAGVLGIQIGGTNTYFGQKVYKPTIGDKLRDIEINDIDGTIRIMYGTSLVAVVFFLAMKFVLIYR